MTKEKKRHIISYENMPAELAAAFAEKYPKGFTDYLQDLTKYTKPDGTPFYAVLIDSLPEDTYLVKIKVRIDDAEEIERWLEGEEEAETEQVAGTSAGSGTDGETLPDDNISQYGGDDDPGDGDA